MTRFPNKSLSLSVSLSLGTFDMPRAVTHVSLQRESERERARERAQERARESESDRFIVTSVSWSQVCITHIYVYTHTHHHVCARARARIYSELALCVARRHIHSAAPIGLVHFELHTIEHEV